MHKIVINDDFGGFSLSRKAFHRLRELGQKDALLEPDFGECWLDGSGPRNDGIDSFLRDIPRDDSLLIQVVEELGVDANGGCASLKIVEIPDDIDWEIDEYDGNESIDEKHRTWR